MSPSRICLRLMSSSLWSVARETVTPPTSTGSRIAHGLSAPVRPTRIAIVSELRLRRHRRPLEGTRPAGPLVERAETPLLVDRVDLDHDPVDLVVELDPPASPTRRSASPLPRSTRAAPRTDSCGTRAPAATAASPTGSRTRLRRGGRSRTSRPRAACGASPPSSSGAPSPRRRCAGFGVGFFPSATRRSFSARKPDSGM